MATSAVREAENGGDFLEIIRRETGIKVNVITGDEEARLIYLAVKHSIPFTREPYVIVDIGGGSVEVIVANDKGVMQCWSLKLGTLRLGGDVVTKDPPSEKELKKLENHISKTLRPVLSEIKNLKIKTAIGTSGTILNLVAMAHWAQYNTPIEMRNHYRIEAEQIKHQHEHLIHTDRKDREKIRGLDDQRVDLIIPGSCVFVSLLKKIGIQDVLLCDEAIREGVIYDYLDRNKSKIEMESLVPDIRRRSVLQLARKCGLQEKHMQHVTGLALSLFDQTKFLHKLTGRERDLLEFSSLLHDIGTHINYKKHYRHAYYIVKNSDMNGFEEKEIELIANIVRYQTKSRPKKSHENWIKLSKSDQQLVRVCSAILRLADALDRTRFSVIKGVNVSVQKSKLGNKIVHKIMIDVKAQGDPELEIWTAQKEKDSLEEVFGQEVVILLKRQKKRK
ncbi:MAG: Ppx/GppA family phosphatase [Deltaproteobacteria bacterium]|nr:MAG: Ppx/GppA family phosphatase [Deltaproteobacteria bacterium]